MNARLIQCVLMIALAAAALPARGEVLINVDLAGGTSFGGSGTGPTYTGPGIMTLAPTDQWNGVTAGPNRTGVALTDSTGAATGATLDLSGFAWAITLPTAFIATPFNALMIDFFGNNTVPITITFHNLPANHTAEFVLYGQAQNAAGSSGGSATVNATTLSWFNNNLPSTFTEGVNFVHFQSVLTDGSGNLVITVTPAPAHEVDINGFQLLIPEPASAAVLFLGAAIALRRRTRWTHGGRISKT